MGSINKNTGKFVAFHSSLYSKVDGSCNFKIFFYKNNNDYISFDINEIDEGNCKIEDIAILQSVTQHLILVSNRYGKLYIFELESKL